MRLAHSLRARACHCALTTVYFARFHDIVLLVIDIAQNNSVSAPAAPAPLSSGARAVGVLPDPVGGMLPPDGIVKVSMPPIDPSV